MWPFDIANTNNYDPFLRTAMGDVVLDTEKVKVGARKAQVFTQFSPTERIPGGDEKWVVRLRVDEGLGKLSKNVPDLETIM